MGAAVPGELLLDPATIENPYHFYRQLVAEAPVWQAGESDIFTVSSYERLTEAAGRVEDFSSNLRYLLYRDERGLPARERHGLPDVQILATVDPPVHAVHRKIVAAAFSPNRLAALEATIAALTVRLVNEALSTGEIDFMATVANLIPIEIVSALVGFKDADVSVLLKAAFASTDILAGVISCETLRERTSFSTETSLWIARQLESAIGEHRAGIIGELAEAVQSNVIEPIVAIAILHILLSAGGESTTSLIGNAVRILAEDGALQQQLRGNPALIPSFVEEVLRLEAPFRHHMRWVPKATTLGGIHIPAGATVLLMWGAANRDPEKFERPDELILDRPRRHVTFGSGIHTCLGNTLARLEARMVIQTLLRLTRALTLDARRPIKRVQSLAVRRYEELPLVLRAN
jgi:cytochrome P450